MQKELLKRVIKENHEFLNSIKRHLIKREFIIPETIRKVVVVYGVRRSGKSFFLFSQFLKNPTSGLYIDFEDERLIGFSFSDFELLKEAFFELNSHLIGKRVRFFLDEVQNIEGWEKFARRIMERENIDVFIAGSSSKLTPEQIHTALRGREWAVEILPFSFREFLWAKGVKQPPVYGRERAKIISLFEEYLKWGGFPEVVIAKRDFEKKQILKDYLDAMFFKDIVEKFSLTNLTLLGSLKDALFSSFSSKFSLSRFYKKIKGLFPFSKTSLYAYYEAFLQSLLIYEVRKFSDSVYVKMRNPAKIYLVDIGLAKRVNSEDKGRLLENLVFLELKRRGYTLHYFSNEKECDFVAQKDGKIKLFQVTLTLGEQNFSREIEGIFSAAKFFGLKEGMVLTLEEEKELEKDGIEIRIMPVWKWIIAQE